jgi:pyruvate-formate lyase-activating enzyme
MLFTLPRKFSDPDITAKGERRASVGLKALKTLWFNTGTLCNIACENCYIESSPRNDRLVYLSREDVRGFLAEAASAHADLEEIGFTGGEPFMNRDIVGMLEDALSGGWRVLVLTNAMRPMQRLKAPLLALRERYGARLAIRVSLDHYTPTRHEAIRGSRTWGPALDGIAWLARNGFDLAIASRLLWEESDAEVRQGFGALFAERGIPVDAHHPSRLVLFPEMDAASDPPEITEACWGILGKSPESVMCASSRMVVKHKGAEAPSVIACTLLPYEPAFDLGPTLAGARGPVKLNHVHCAKFCVLGGASCSA